MHSNAELEQCQVEWQAWRTVCRELERSGIDLNGDNQLAAALELWGEELVDLRRRQDRYVIERVLMEKQARFASLGMELATQ